MKRILVPMDFCDCSRAALEYAVDLSKVFDASMDVLHVVEVPQFDSPPMPSPISRNRLSLSQFAMNEASRKLAEMLEPVKRRSSAVEYRAVPGYPKDVILAEANAGQYDVVVVGTHGRKGFSHFFLGSVAEQIVRRASCPVLTIRTP